MMPLNSAYNERFKRGTAEFPFDYHYIDKNHPRFVMPFHYHVDFEIIRVLKGRLRIILNEKSYALTAGDYLFIEGGIIHGGYTDNREDVYECIVFNLEAIFDKNDPLLAPLHGLLNHQLSLNTLYHKNDVPKIAAACDDFFDEVRSPAGHGLLAYAALTRLLALIFNEGRYSNFADKISSRYLKHIRKGSIIFRFMFDNYAEDITLDDLASCVGLNPKYFCKFFKELTGDRPIDYLNRFRIECAAVKLTSADIPVSQIAYDCGFKDPCYFTKLFKRYKKLSPRDFRQIHSSISDKDTNPS